MLFWHYVRIQGISFYKLQLTIHLKPMLHNVNFFKKCNLWFNYGLKINLKLFIIWSYASIQSGPMKHTCDKTPNSCTQYHWNNFRERQESVIYDNKAYQPINHWPFSLILMGLSGSLANRFLSASKYSHFFLSLNLLSPEFRINLYLKNKLKHLNRIKDSLE